MTTPHARNDPDDFPDLDIDTATGSAYHADDDMAAACPGCDTTTSVQFRLSKHPPFRCSHCKSEFGEPVRRGKYRAGRKGSGGRDSKNKLIEMDPEDVDL